MIFPSCPSRSSREKLFSALISDRAVHPESFRGSAALPCFPFDSHMAKLAV